MVIKSMTIQVKAAHIMKCKGSSSDKDEEPHENTSDRNNNKNSNSNSDDEERPKRGRSAYNYFFRAERAKLLGISETDLEAQQHQKRKHRKTPGMNGFASLASSVGGRWKKLSETEKLPYQLKSQQDRERSQRDLEDWRRKHGLLPASPSNTGDGAAAFAGSSVASSSSSREQAPYSFCSSQEHARKTSSSSLPASKRRRQHDAQIIVHETRMKAAAASELSSPSTKYPSSIYIEVQQNETRRRTSDKQECRLRVEEPAFEPISVKDLHTSSVNQVPTRRTIRNHKEVVIDKPFEPISFKDIRKTSSSSCSLNQQQVQRGHHKISARHAPPITSPELFEPVSLRNRSYRALPATGSTPPIISPELFEPVSLRHRSYRALPATGSTPPITSPELFEPVSLRHRSYRALPATGSTPPITSSKLFEPVSLRHRSYRALPATGSTPPTTSPELFDPVSLRNRSYRALPATGSTPPITSPELFEPVSLRHRSYRALPATGSPFEPVPIRDIAALEHRHNRRFVEMRHDHAHAHDRGLQELSTLKEWNVLLQNLRN
jgi:hypothetical protein